MFTPLQGQNCWRSASADLVKTEPSPNSSLRLLGNGRQQRLTVWQSGSSRLPLLDSCCSFFFSSCPFSSFLYFMTTSTPSPHHHSGPSSLHQRQLNTSSRSGQRWEASLHLTVETLASSVTALLDPSARL